MWLDIDIGDAVAHKTQSEAHQRAQDFLAAVGRPQLGLPSSLADLDDEQTQTLRDAYEADPSWADQGPMQVAAPPALRAGRIVAQLLPGDAPKACENFRCLITGEKGLGKASKKPLSFQVCARGGGAKRMWVHSQEGCCAVPHLHGLRAASASPCRARAFTASSKASAAKAGTSCAVRCAPATLARTIHRGMGNCKRLPAAT